MDFYSVLDVPSTATSEEIKHSFRQLAKRYHPDVSSDPDAERHFKLVYIAYEILSDSYKRKIYDELQDWHALRMQQWKYKAAQQAGIYANMRYNQFENKVLANIKFHAGQGLGFLFSFIIMCLGFLSILLGAFLALSPLVKDTLVVGLAMIFFGVVILVIAIKGVWSFLNK